MATNIGLLSYTDNGLSNDTAYYYVVRAVNATGQSPDSAEIAATPILVGLKGDYYDNMDFTGFVVSRVDPGVNFDWGNGSPDPSIGVDTFSVRWTGQVVPLFSETYTFFTLSDDGVRLWVNGVQLVSNWTDHPPTENSGAIALTSGVRYSIQMDYYEKGGGATAALSWSSSSQTKEIIPANRLFPPVSVTPPQLGFTISGNAMRFTWPADHIGWRLVAQTNSIGAGLGPTWTTVPDSTATNQIFVPINPANGSAFFRLVYP